MKNQAANSQNSSYLYEQKRKLNIKLIEAKQERMMQIKRREEEKRAEEKRLKDLALLVRPGDGMINWKQIVEAKRRKKREQEELQNEGKPNPFRLDR